jgi:hypothetical protein
MRKNFVNEWIIKKVRIYSADPTSPCYFAGYFVKICSDTVVVFDYCYYFLLIQIASYFLYFSESNPEYKATILISKIITPLYDNIINLLHCCFMYKSVLFTIKKFKKFMEMFLYVPFSRVSSILYFGKSGIYILSLLFSYLSCSFCDTSLHYNPNQSLFSAREQLHNIDQN